MPEGIAVNGDVITWARERAGTQPGGSRAEVSEDRGVGSRHSIAELSAA